MAEWSFWLFLVLVLCGLAGYPLAIASVGLFFARPVMRDTRIRQVDVVVPVHNGGARIEEKILNCLTMDYPPDARRIWIVSDGSTDNTVSIAARYRDRGILCLEIPQRVGKVVAQNRVLSLLDSEIVVFTDLATTVGADALKQIVSNFADPTVGVVSCRDQTQDTGGVSTGEAAYVAYDMLVRDWSSRAGSLVGVTGGFYALRRELANSGWDPAYPPDFYAVLHAVERGYRAVQDERVRAYYPASSAASGEFHRKVRTTTRGMWALFDNFHLLNPLQYRLFSFELFGQKILRWLMPFLLIGLLVTNVIAFVDQPASWTLHLCLLGQVGFYSLGAFGLFAAATESRMTALTAIPTFFVISNAAILASWRNLLRGMRYTIWTPTQR